MNQPSGQRPTWAAISLSSLAHNYRTLKRHVGERVQLMAVVKANAYGHGAIECARALEETGADWFGVALVEEGVALRRAGVHRPIFCLGGFWRGQGEAVVAYELTPALFSLPAAEELDARARAQGRTVSFHLKVDTGMGRLGIPVAEVAPFARALSQFKNLRFDGLLTHFAEADALESDYTEIQIEQYCEALHALHELGIHPTYQHLANSAGIHAHRSAWGNLARAGATLYGLVRDVLAPIPEPFAVQPVMSLHSRVVFLKSVPAGTSLGYGRTFVTERESRIATLPIGYADGLRRALSNQGNVIIRGQLAPIVGRVSMDLTLIDVTEAPEVAMGDEAVLIGERDGLRISAEDIAEQCDTISYEVVCGISARVPRVYVR
jgi:alanine racemase